MVALFLAGGTLALGAVTKTYSGSFRGTACTVQMNWYDWKGLGAIDGRITLANGTTILFAGRNSQPGVLELRADGRSFRLVRQDSGRQTSWVSAQFSFTEAAPTPSPTPSPSPSPTPEIFETAMTEQTYTGTWKGKAFKAEMRWAPGDSPGVLQRGRGKMMLEDGTEVAIEGWQRSAESAEFKFGPDEGAESFQTTKVSSDDKVTWESEALTMTENK